MSVYMITLNCTQMDKDWKLKGYYFQTEKNFVEISFLAVSGSDYDTNVGAFDKSAATLSIPGTITAPSIILDSGPATAAALKPHLERVDIGSGKTVNLTFDTSSNISGFVFDEAGKKITFSVSGADGTNGTTELNLGALLLGPYLVSLDGHPVTNFETGTDPVTGGATVTIHYHHSSHEITVAGSQVVPEFALPLVGMLSALMAIVALIGRKRPAQSLL